MKKYGIIIILFLIIIIGGALFWLNKDNTMSVASEEKTTLSPTQVESIEAIGQWEFLAINDVNTLGKSGKRIANLLATEVVDCCRSNGC